MIIDWDTTYDGLVADTPSRSQKLHRSDKKAKVRIGLFSYPKCRFIWAI